MRCPTPLTCSAARLTRKICHGRITLRICATRGIDRKCLTKAVPGANIQSNVNPLQDDDEDVSVTLAMALGSRSRRRRMHLRYRTNIKVRAAVFPRASHGDMPSDHSQRILNVSIPPWPWDAHCVQECSPRLCVAIPSKGRWHRNAIIDHALHLLLKHGLKQECIHVFVIEKEYDLYRQALDEAALIDIRIIVGKDGLTAQMNYMRRFFPSGTLILGCNDLLSDVVQKIDDHTSIPMSAGMLLHWVHHAYAMMQRYGVSLCGLAPSTCLLKMSTTNISQRFGLVNGSLYLEINRRNPSLFCKGSGLIWDMEHTYRVRQTYGPSLRYLVFAAHCKYRQPGGHSTSFVSPMARQLATDKEIKTSAAEFPQLLKYTPMKYRTMSAFNYTCQHVGGHPFKLMIPSSCQKVGVGSVREQEARQRAAVLVIGSPSDKSRCGYA